jgi:16S rRNA G966 N2-methylase RsmD
VTTTALAIRDQQAVPALLEQAEQALELVRDQEQAEALWRRLAAIDEAARLARVHGDVQLRAGRLRLRAERRWGELLGPADEQSQERADDGTFRVTGSNAVNGSDRVARHRAREVAAVDADVFTSYLERTRDPELLRRARLLRLQREHEADRRRRAPVGAAAISVVRYGDLRDVLDDLAGTVDAIVTDPPYGAAHLDEFDALGELAARLLTPTGLLVVMVGQTHLPRYLERLERHLVYRWTAAFLTSGPATRVHRAKVGTFWKPLLIFDRGSDRRFIVQDVVRSGGPAKALADGQVDGWSQSVSGMSEILERITVPGELVVDPFCGAGTTGVACRALDRRFIGCDRDADAVTVARRRLDGDAG